MISLFSIFSFLAVSFLSTALALTVDPTWTVSIHGGQIQHNATRALSAFALAKDLGARGVRSDIFWDEIRPSRNTTWDASKVDFYTQYFREAGQVLGGSIVILSGPPAWAKQLFQTNRTDFFAEWSAYLQKAIEIVGDSPVLAWQLWNEMNHVPSAWINTDQEAVCKIFNMAGEAVAKRSIKNLRGSHAPRFVNVMADDPNLPTVGLQGWRNALNRWLNTTHCAGSVIDGIGLDHYPGTWTLSRSLTDWSPLRELLDRVRVDKGAPGWQGKLPAVMETGFSTWNTVLAPESRQTAFCDQSLDTILAMLRSHHSQIHADASPSPIIVNFYQLIDEDTTSARGGIRSEVRARDRNNNGARSHLSVHLLPMPGVKELRT